MATACNIRLCYKNFSKDCQTSHMGLGVTALFTAKTLTRAGFHTEALPIYGGDDLGKYLRAQSEPVTHVIIMAQWIPTRYLAKLSREFPHTQFALNCHSNCGFLQAEPAAIDLLREAIDLQTGSINFRAAANSTKLSHALQAMYGHPVSFLPNLYYLHGHEPIHRPGWNGGVLKIGCFGALRIYKNISSAVAAAIELTQSLKCHSEIWINSGRNDGNGSVVNRTAVAWTKGLSNITLKELPWCSWPEFKRASGGMNLLFQPSYTESFNNVTADGIAEGTPSVVGEAIEWVPHSWKANADNSSDIAGVARRLLFDPLAPHEGYQALKSYVRHGIEAWREFLL